MTDCVLNLKREASVKPERGEWFTRGIIYSPDSDQSPFCYSVEDRVRPEGEKVYGQTAIAEGIYELKNTFSNRFKKRLPILLGVKNFEGVRIHAGNTAENSEGCILVGTRQTANGVSNCAPSVDAIIALIDANADVGVRTLLNITNGV